MVSNLILDFPDTFDVRTLRINDSSAYTKGLTIECGLIEVIPPGYTESVNFNVDKGFSLVLNSSNLKLAKTRVYKDLTTLPDGIYKIKYSIKPNDKAWVEYDYFRVNSIMKRYYEERCCVKLEPYIMDKKTREALKRLWEIRTYIDQAKIEVEECGNRGRGVELYAYAQELLNKGVCVNCK